MSNTINDQVWSNFRHPKDSIKYMTCTIHSLKTVQKLSVELWTSHTLNESHIGSFCSFCYVTKQINICVTQQLVSAALTAAKYKTAARDLGHCCPFETSAAHLQCTAVKYTALKCTNGRTCFGPHLMSKYYQYCYTFAYQIINLFFLCFILFYQLNLNYNFKFLVIFLDVRCFFWLRSPSACDAKTLKMKFLKKS